MALSRIKIKLERRTRKCKHHLILIAKQKGWQYDEDVQDMICPECLEKTE